MGCENPKTNPHHSICNTFPTYEGIQARDNLIKVAQSKTRKVQKKPSCSTGSRMYGAMKLITPANGSPGGRSRALPLTLPSPRSGFENGKAFQPRISRYHHTDTGSTPQLPFWFGLCALPVSLQGVILIRGRTGDACPWLWRKGGCVCRYV